MAQYRDWSWTANHGAQGPGDWDEEGLDDRTLDLLQELAMEWLEASAGSSDDLIATEANRRLAEVRRPVQAGSQGPVSRVARTTIAALAEVPIFGSGTYGAVQRVNRTNLWQVTAYVNDLDNAKREIWERFRAVAGDDTRIVLAHSLGTVVAYEAIREFDLKLDLLLTTGSPLGLGSVVYPKLIPDASFPPNVARWVNVADPDDVIAARPSLAGLFPDRSGKGRRIEDIRVSNSGPLFRHHHITEYLKHDEVRAVFWEALG